MLPKILYKIPKDAMFSEDLKERSIACMMVMVSGNWHYVPITKELKKLLKIPSKKGKLIISWDMTNLLEYIFRDVINAVYLQVRDTVGEEIEATVLKAMHNRIDELIYPQLHKGLKKVLTKKMKALPPGDKNAK